jgi:predicted nucleic acid-binding protein
VTYLIDTSALVRVIRRQATEQWYEQIERGLVAICEPVLIETLTMADAKSYERVEADLRDTYPWVVVPDDVWDVVRATRRELAAHSQHQGLSVADHLVLATALRHQRCLLHEDADFETAARLVPELQQVRLSSSPAAPAGSN